MALKFNMNNEQIMFIYLLWLINNPSGTPAQFFAFVQSALNFIENNQTDIINLFRDS